MKVYKLNWQAVNCVFRSSISHSKRSKPFFIKTTFDTVSNDFTTLLLVVIVIDVTLIIVSRVGLDFDIELVFDKLHECDEWKGYAEEVKSIRKT